MTAKKSQIDLVRILTNQVARMSRDLDELFVRLETLERKVSETKLPTDYRSV